MGIGSTRHEIEGNPRTSSCTKVFLSWGNKGRQERAFKGSKIPSCDPTSKEIIDIKAPNNGEYTMGIPNIQQQMYLKKALNENMDRMFDHSEAQIEESITEGLLRKIELAEGSIRASKIGKGKKFSPKMYDKYKTKNAVRQLIKTGRDPNSIKFPLTRGLENFGFNVNAEDKRKAALKAKGKKA
jgi:hypothetical protein